MSAEAQVQRRRSFEGSGEDALGSPRKENGPAFSTGLLLPILSVGHSVAAELSAGHMPGFVP